jgi:hypothetical protein
MLLSQYFRRFLISSDMRTANNLERPERGRLGAAARRHAHRVIDEIGRKDSRIVPTSLDQLVGAHKQRGGHLDWTPQRRGQFAGLQAREPDAGQ